MKGLILLVLLTLGAFSGVVLLIPTVMLIFVHSKRIIGWRRKYVSVVSGIYFDFAAALIRLIGGTKMFIYSKSSASDLLNDRSALLICNHRSLVDWMFAGWYYAFHLNLNADLRVILKESLRSVPIYGWSMQIMMYIFLSRKREQDIPYIRRILSYLLCTGHAPSLLLFPEGTDLNENNKKKSNAYAQMNNLPDMEYVLYPKPSGLLCCLNTLKERRESLDCRIHSDNYRNAQITVDGGVDGSNGAASSSLQGVMNVGSAANVVNVGEKKEHKADCVPSSSTHRTNIQKNESKDGSLRGKVSGSQNEVRRRNESKQDHGGVTSDFSNSDTSELKIRSEKGQWNCTTALHDLTIAYKDCKKGKKTSDRSILYGEFPPEVHILVDRYAIEDVPTEKQPLEQWLRDSFHRKEKLLKEFYESDNIGSATNKWPNRVEIAISDRHPILCVSTWIAVTFSGLYFYSWYRWLVVCMVITCIAVRTFNGFDSVELALHGDMVLREAKIRVDEQNELQDALNVNDDVIKKDN